MSTIYISKSQFLKGLQCPKALYLHTELAGETSESREALLGEYSGTHPYF